MLTLGILSLIQIVFLPGYLVLRLSRLNRGYLSTLFMSFALSLVINYFLVLFLVLINSYTSITIYLVFALEILLLLKSFKLKPNVPLIKNQNTLHSLTAKQSPICLALTFIFLLIIAVLAYNLHIHHHNSQAIFYCHDAILRWNTWAVAWFNNTIPQHTWYYPQLLPTNWSITYAFMNSSKVQIFAVFLMPLFPFAIFIGMLDLAIKRQNFSYVIGLILSALLFYTILGTATVSGYADIPCAFLAFAAIYTLLLCQNEEKPQSINQLLIIGAIFSAGSALTKQAGLTIAVLYPIFACLFVVKQNKEISLKTIFTITGLVLLIVTSWYLYKFMLIHSGIATSEAVFNKHSITYYFILSLPHRFLFSMQLITSALGNIYVFSALVVAIVLGSIISQTALWLLLLLIIPYSIIYALNFGYDLRNLAFIIPFIGLTAGYGINWLKNKTEKLYYFNKKTFYIGFILIIIITLAITSNKYDKHTILKSQATAKLQIGYPPANKMVYRYFLTNALEGMILSNYVYITKLPVLSQHTKYVKLPTKNNLEQMVKKYNIKYILVYKISLGMQLLENKHIQFNIIQKPIEASNAFPKSKMKFNLKGANQYLRRQLLNNNYFKHRLQIIKNDKFFLFAKIK